MKPGRVIAVLATVAVILVGGLSASILGYSPLPAKQRFTACFSDVGGLRRGDPVMVRGLHVGRVGTLRLDAQFRPCAELLLDSDVALADDTSAAIVSLNMLGDRGVDLDPGGSSDILGDRAELMFTQGALPLERMLGRLLSELESGD